MFHMGWFVGGGYTAQGWGGKWSGNAGRDAFKPDLFVDMATSLERAGFDYMMLEDASLVNDVYKGSLETTLSRGGLRNDPMTLVPLLGKVTKHLGIIATASTSFYPPYLAARLATSLDNLTDGRFGFNLVTGSAHAAAQNYGLDKHYEHDLRYEMADEWVDCVKALWDTWDPGALVLDEETGVFADASKVHYADFKGRWYASRGPLNSVPAPQGHPVICQAGGSPAGRDFGARNADTLIASLVEEPGVENMKAYRADISERMIKFGRKPTDAKVMYMVQPILADSDAEAREKQQAMRAADAANTDALLMSMSYFSGKDFSGFDLDAPVPDLDGHNGHKSLVDAFLKNAEGKTLRQAIADRAQTAGSVELVGTPDSVAVQMGEIMDEVGGDGYLIHGLINRGRVTQMTDGLAPALRRRGLIRSEYAYDTFKENLLAF
ncbi:MAG: FMNH2-dependent monooxygenase [Pseudonocardiales bacterium]|nr:FMNH2-dependent monooxygenase [Pseudonocardiales bacterium]